MKKHIFTALFVVAMSRALPVGAEDFLLAIGEDDRWSDVIATENVVFVEGKRGYLDAVIKDTAATLDPGTDMLVTFDRSPLDLTGNYILSSSSASTHSRAARRGEGGGVFTGAPDGIEYIPGRDSALAPDESWSDFSIEFWLYPALLDDGATILHWTGARYIAGRTALEEIRVYISGRHLVWEFENVFMPSDLSEFIVELEGVQVLLPRRWHHHLFRFRGETGLAEYLVDGEIAAITHATASGHESDDVYSAFTGNALKTDLAVGEGFTGFIDELRISTTFIERLELERYPSEKNSFTTRVFDLHYSNSRLVSIDADYAEPDDSTALFYYRIGETLSGPSSIGAHWTPFLPGARFGDTDRGRYLQLYVELYPDGGGEVTPVVHDLTIRYEPDLPPHPPEQVRATALDGGIRIEWKRSLDSDVAGYLVYYGDRSMWYFGEDASQGISPIDIGDVDSYTLSGLTNGKLYYVSIAAYDSGASPHQSEFSEETSARPTRLFGSN